MKRFITILLLLVMISVYLSADNGLQDVMTAQQMVNGLVQGYATTKGNVVSYSFTLDTKGLINFDEMVAELPALVRSFALPAQKATLSIQSMTIETYIWQDGIWTLSTIPYTENKKLNTDLIYIDRDFIFKELRGFSVFVDLFTIKENRLNIITSADFTLTGSGYYEAPTEISEAFETSYRNLVENYDTSYLRNLHYKKPSMIILTQSEGLANSAVHRNFVAWKKSIGFDIHLVYKTDIGTNPTNTQIQTHLRNLYATMENKPDYLLLIGHARSGTTLNLVPTFTMTGPDGSTNSTDLPYSLLAGDDYFPEVLVGRFSISSNNDLATLMTKTEYYEKGNLNNANGWMDKGVVVAANYDAGGANVSTPVLMSRWIAEKMRSYGFQTTELYHEESAQTSDIVNAVNQSAQFITYRGWGNATGWHYPSFSISNLQPTFNGGRLPIVYSIVCATGDYTHQTHNPCFAEAWMRKETSGQHDGAVAFVAPTYLHTSTEYNNCIGSGMIYGVFDEGIRIFGASVMRGKIELYRNYPRELDFNGIIHFYWSTYNILSDPSLNMWFRQPGNISMSLPSEVNVHTSHIELNAGNINRGYATATKDNVTFTYARIVDGYAILPLPNDESGEAYKVTIYTRNMNPMIQMVNINSANASVGLISTEVISGQFASGQSATLRLTFKNFSSETINVGETTLTSTSEFVTVTTYGNPVGSLPPNGTGEQQYNVILAHNCPNDIDIPFNVEIIPGNNAKFALATTGYIFDITSVTPAGGHISPGETKAIEVNIINASTINATSITATVRPLVNAVTIPSPDVSIGNITAGAEGSFSFNLTVAADCFIGRNARFVVDFKKDDTIITQAYFSIVIGIVDQTAPTGPDGWGYYAYDINDVGWDWTPVYDWVDISDSPTFVSLGDDETQFVTLPFPFRFYGVDHTQIGINDNGWIAFMGEEYWYKNDFRNWYIPSPLGPPNQIAVFWDDMKGQIIGGSGTAEDPFIYANMNVKYHHDTANNRFIVQWDDVYFSRDQTQVTGVLEYQVILIPRDNEDGDILTQYKTIRNFSETTNYSTIGIQNFSHSDGLCYTYSNFYPASATPLQNNLAILFTKRAPDPYVDIDDDVVIYDTPRLLQNYPNPFNPQTTIAFEIRNAKSEMTDVSIDIYNIKGQKVKTLINGSFATGTHSVVWNGQDDNGRDLPSGMYFYQMKTDGLKQTKQMLLLK